MGFKVADNRDNGMEIQETHGVWGGPLIEVIIYILIINVLNELVVELSDHFTH